MLVQPNLLLAESRSPGLCLAHALGGLRSRDLSVSTRPSMGLRSRHIGVECLQSVLKARIFVPRPRHALAAPIVGRGSSGPTCGAASLDGAPFMWGVFGGIFGNRCSVMKSTNARSFGDISWLDSHT